MINTDKSSKIDIVKFSRIGSVILVFALVLSYIVQVLLSNQIKELETKKIIAEEAYESLHEFKYQTELLLTSYEIENKREKYINSYNYFDLGMNNFFHNFEVDESIHRYYEIIDLKIVDLFKILNKDIFKEENQMYKPILVRFGELNRTEESSEYYLTIKSFYEKVQHIKQYQDFLLEDIKEIKLQLIREANIQINIFYQWFTYLPLLIIFVAILFSFIIDKFILQKEKNLLTANSLLENIMDSIPVRIFWKDTKGRYKGANKLFLDDARVSSIDEILGKTDFELTWKDIAHEYIKDDKEVIKSRKSKLNIQEEQTREDGSKSYLNTSKVPLFDENGNVIGVIGLYEDITYKVEAQEKIKQQELQLLQQNRLAQMGELIAMIAHQWRQPLTVVGTTTATLQLKIQNNSYEPKLFIDRLEKIDNQVEYLSQTIEDFRTFFKPEQGKNVVQIKHLMDDTLRIIQSTLSKFNIKLINEVTSNKEILTYSNEIKQVILNILKNSLDAFVENGIENRVITINDTVENDLIKIIIEDNAGGIEEGIIQNIFDPYFSTKSEKNGTGLGLYMSKMIIEDHCKGELRVISKEGKTKFEILIRE